MHALQDAITVSQASAGTFEVPNWDPVSQKNVRDALLVLASTIRRIRRRIRHAGTKSIPSST